MKYISLYSILLYSFVVGFATNEYHSRQNERILALARIFVSEVGFDPQAKDLHNIAMVLRNRSRSKSISISIMKAYSSKTFDRNRDDARRWLAHLNLMGAKPEGWPNNASWEKHREEWFKIIEVAREIITTRNIHYSCVVSPLHWGSRWFKVREREAEGWTRINCNGTKNQFWTTFPMSVPKKPIVVRRYNEQSLLCEGV